MELDGSNIVVSLVSSENDDDCDRESFASLKESCLNVLVSTANISEERCVHVKLLAKLAPPIRSMAYVLQASGLSRFDILQGY